MKLFIEYCLRRPEQWGGGDVLLRYRSIEGGTVSGIELAGNTGAPNRYTCWLRCLRRQPWASLFRVQKMNAADNETVPLAIGKKEMNEDGLPSVAVFDESAYTIGESRKKIRLELSGSEGWQANRGRKWSLGSGVPVDQWYWLEMAFNGNRWMTIIIGPETPEAGKLRKDSIHAEIRLVSANCSIWTSRLTVLPLQCEPLRLHEFHRAVAAWRYLNGENRQSVPPQCYAYNTGLTGQF